MSRKKAKTGKKLSYWCSGASDCSENFFVQLGVSLANHPAFTGLKDSAKWVYICMRLEARGRPDFQFSRRTAAKYGIAEQTLYRSVKLLVNAGFVDVVASGRSNKTATDYCFSVRWKTPP